jgi:hypothetical protein
MSAMADLDITLINYKLSDAQKNAVVELFEGGATVAKAVTFKALERKGLVTMVDGFWQLDAEFRNKLRGEANPVEEIQAELNTNMWADPVITEEEKATFAAMVETFKGVGDGWYNTEVWDGLSLEEIKEDLETAFPVNRAAKRKHFRMLRNANRRSQVATLNTYGYSRRQIKVCGGKG